MHRCVLGVCFSPDSNYLLGGTDEGAINIWSLNAEDDFKLV
jgi:WD40 repeat protein